MDEPRNGPGQNRAKRRFVPFSGVKDVAKRSQVARPFRAHRTRRAFAIAKSTVEHVADGGTDRAAAMAYYAMQSLFPGILMVVLVSILLSTPETVTSAVDWAQDQGLDPDLADALQTTLRAAVQRASGPIGAALVVAALTSLSGASGWLAAVGRAIEPDSNRRRDRGQIFGRLRFALWTLLLVIAVVLALIALSLGGEVADTIFRWVGFEEGAPAAWTAVRPPLIVLGLIGTMWALFRIAPDRVHPPKWRHLLPGAVLAGVGYLVATLGFAFYVRNIATLGTTYGTFATPIVLLIWLWLTSLMVLVGAELNAELARRRGEYHGPARLEYSDDPRVAGHPVAALPDPRDDDRLLHDD